MYQPLSFWRVVTLPGALALAACGGGGELPAANLSATIAAPPQNCAAAATATASEAVPSINAVVGGLLTDASGPHWLVLVAQSDGGVIAWYGDSVATVSPPTGRIAAAAPWWTSSDPDSWYNARGWPTGEAACLEVSYDSTVPLLAGTLRPRSGSGATISGGSIPDSAYAFDQPATAETSAGRWELNTGTTITVSDTGEFTSTIFGCEAHGALAPASDGKNWLRLTIQVTDTCEIGGGIKLLQGHAVVYSTASVSRILLHASGDNGFDYVNFDAIGLSQSP